MTRSVLTCLTLLLGVPCVASAREAKLVRYPDYHAGKIAFAYLGDIWTADEDGKNVQRLTVHTARDIHPRFSPDGRSIAFSSDREGNMDVYLIPAAGGAVKRLTIHSADDTVVEWTPDGKGILFASQPRRRFPWENSTWSRSTAACLRDAGPDMGVTPAHSAPDGTKLAVNRKGQGLSMAQVNVTAAAYQERTPSLSWTSPPRLLKDVGQGFDGMDSWPLWEPGRAYLLRERPRAVRDKPIFGRVGECGGVWRRRRASDAIRQRRCPVPGISGDGKTIVFRTRLRHLEARPSPPERGSSPSRSRSPPKPRRL